MIDTLVEEVEPIVIEKNEYKYRDVSKIIAFCAVFKLSGFRRGEQSQLYLSRIAFLK